MSVSVNKSKSHLKTITNKQMSAKLQQTYTKYTHVEHVLKLPDTYVGSVEHHEEIINVCDEENNIVPRKIKYVPALYKIYDEILVNAVDQHTRCEATKGVKKVGTMEIKSMMPHQLKIYFNGLSEIHILNKYSIVNTIVNPHSI